MKRAIATALVLIAGAAVVLWYGNTLNSWVLGGLIGGLAALLLSIPISLTLFSYLTRRQEEERLRNEMFYQYDDDIYEADYEYLEEPEYEYGRKRVYPAQLPERVRRNTYEMPAEEMPTRRYVEAEAYSVAETPTPKATRPLSRGKQTRRLNKPSFPGYQIDPTQSQFRTQALRAARKEASQQRPIYQEPETEAIDDIPPMGGNMKKPLQRRAPYTYEDDAIRQRLSRELDASPITRRQSRRLYDEDE